VRRRHGEADFRMIRPEDNAIVRTATLLIGVACHGSVDASRFHTKNAKSSDPMSTRSQG
jgi:hypothetical protein